MEPCCTAGPDLRCRLIRVYSQGWKRLEDLGFTCLGLVRACGQVAPMQFPMYTVPAKRLLEMTKIQPHEELKAASQSCVDPRCRCSLSESSIAIPGWCSVHFSFSPRTRHWHVHRSCCRILVTFRQCSAWGPGGRVPQQRMSRQVRLRLCSAKALAAVHRKALLQVGEICRCEKPCGPSVPVAWRPMSRCCAIEKQFWEAMCAQLGLAWPC